MLRESSKRKFGLDLMRSVAVILVIFSHYLPHWAPHDREVELLAGPLGILGVELFFVLSGFLIGGILLRSVLTSRRVDFSFICQFWMRRWLRTLPNYLLFLGLAIGLEASMGASRPEEWRYLLFLQNWAWPLDQTIWNVSSGFFDVTWSLAFEEWFYLLFPILLALMIRLTRNKIGSFVSVGSLVIIGSVLARALWLPDPGWDFGIRKVVVFRLDALMYGVLAAFLSIRLRPAHWTRMRQLYPFAAIALVGFWLYLSRQTEGLNASFTSLGTRTFLLPAIDLACVGLLPWLEQLRKWKGLKGRVVSAISLWSYSLYLCHALPLSIGTFAIAKALDSPPSQLSDFAHRCIAAVGILIIFPVSKLIYEKFELPIMQLRTEQGSRKSRQ